MSELRAAFTCIWEENGPMTLGKGYIQQGTCLPLERKGGEFTWMPLDFTSRLLFSHSELYHRYRPDISTYPDLAAKSEICLTELP